MNKFVFVVCGAEKHINTLDYSLNFLKHFSNLSIIVVTDSLRNEIKIIHENIIDVKTPVNLNNHEASIWLKTSLHKILPSGPLYCYLDSDVIAVNKNCDKIFNNYNAPITFAADHCNMSLFSPYAINCNCLDKYTEDKNNFEKNVSVALNIKNYPPNYSNPNIRKLYKLLQSIKNHPIQKTGSIFRMLLSIIGAELNIKDDIILSKRKKGFVIDNEVFPFLFFYRKAIKEKTNYSFNWLKLKWVKPDKSEFAINSCNHLSVAIKNKFNIEIAQTNWQHWNGGVFLFNEQSNEFMETWHQFTLKIFEDKYWKIRDQGTLIATAWKLGLQNHSVLPTEFNFIADFYKWDITSTIVNNNIKILNDNKTITPNFLHVYHEFGTKGWDLWDCIEKIKP